MIKPKSARALFIQIVLPKYCRKNFISGFSKKYFKLLLDILSEMLKWKKTGGAWNHSARKSKKGVEKTWFGRI
jgi:hypothetical protein